MFGLGHFCIMILANAVIAPGSVKTSIHKTLCKVAIRSWGHLINRVAFHMYPPLIKRRRLAVSSFALHYNHLVFFFQSRPNNLLHCHRLPGATFLLLSHVVLHKIYHITSVGCFIFRPRLGTGAVRGTVSTKILFNGRPLPLWTSVAFLKVTTPEKEIIIPANHEALSALQTSWQ